MGRVGRARARRRVGVVAALIGRETVTDRPRDRASGRRGARSRIASPMLALALIPLFTNWTHRVARRPDRHRATSRATCSTPSSRTACSSPSATTTPSRSGTRRKSKASARTSSSRTRRCSTPTGTRDSSSVARSTSTTRRAGPAIYRGKQLDEADGLAAPHDDRAGRLGAAVHPDRSADELRGRPDQGDDRSAAPLDSGRAPARRHLRAARSSPSRSSDRPIYFSRTSAGYGNELGLGNYLLTQGLATKLFIAAGRPGRRTRCSSRAPAGST